MRIINEKYLLHKDIEIDTVDGFVFEEVVVSDEQIKHYLDTKYTANDIMDLAKQIDPDINNTDLDTAYSLLIDYYDNSDEDSEFETPDLGSMYNYLQEKVTEDFEDEALENYNDAKAEAEAIDEYEDAHRFGEL